ncbi:hypothetical protein Nepgr_006804 [Nepenthes gracilis]|uniref:Secreted protein n=1 Tax=Nepenthes gracilis TaxID=150966 RepID=A0AAD3XHQ1_NEPGR|nr:hypothetical protein Nepgr_006804 [Nepenthes gracilis]
MIHSWARALLYGASKAWEVVWCWSCFQSPTVIVRSKAVVAVWNCVGDGNLLAASRWCSVDPGQALISILGNCQVTSAEADSGCTACASARSVAMHRRILMQCC